MSNQVRFGSFAFRVTPIRMVMMLLALVGIGLMIYRLVYGLGAATNLNDSWPWGLWIGVDVMLGVALAAGGFTMCAVIYVFNLKQFKPLTRPAVLTAWLGYLLVLVGLFLDVGLWYNAWRPLIHWGYTSVLFEVFVCVTIYNIVLLVEFLPVIAERFKWDKVYRITTAVTIPAVIAGIVLSSLHQSSLGALFLIMPDKMHPIWYTDALPWLFLLSAISVGPAMVVIESFLVSKSYKMKFEQRILGQLMIGVAFILAIYLAFNLWNLSNRGYLEAAFAGTFTGNMYLLELALFAFPLLLIIVGPGRKSKGGIVLSALMVVTGVVANRLNVLFTGLHEAAPVSYFPSGMEIMITLGLISIGCLVYLFVVENFNVFPKGVKNNPYIENQQRGFVPIDSGVNISSK
ncbi:Ni/Fe-hydrogenase subunit HybB-like protein [Desulfitispora alkaliphila]|uniref:NrfD/PsrC family molybdoenzyme membrane anchor subunit n=1 Tax=Desulfitispora alkaliphila TaxID=622674 RepID=UPI003D1FB9EC